MYRLFLLIAMVAVVSPTRLAAADSFGSGPNSFQIDFVTIGQPGSLASQIDQLQDVPIGFASNGGGLAAQTFTVGRVGVLDRIEVPLRASSILDFPDWHVWIDVLLLRVVNGIPQGTPQDVLRYSRVEIPSPNFAQYSTDQKYSDFQWILLDGIALPVRNGEQFAIAVGKFTHPTTFFQPDLAFDWIVSDPNQPGTIGEAWGLDGLNPGFIRYGVGVQDFAFRTFVVEVPEPINSAFGLIVGLMGGRMWGGGKKGQERGDHELLSVIMLNAAPL